MKSVFLLWHTNPVDGQEDEKLIGVYRSHEEAQAAIVRVSDKPGFSAAPDCFEISEYLLGKDHWAEGFISQQAAME